MSIFLFSQYIIPIPAMLLFTIICKFEYANSLYLIIIPLSLYVNKKRQCFHTAPLSYTLSFALSFAL